MMYGSVTVTHRAYRGRRVEVQATQTTGTAEVLPSGALVVKAYESQYVYAPGVWLMAHETPPQH